jgi:hypothetical protein
MSRRDRRAAGRKSQIASNSAGMAAPAALYEAGLAHMKAGRYLDAQISCQQALAVYSNQAAGARHLQPRLDRYRPTGFFRVAMDKPVGKRLTESF